jgi:SAM-dependent methyltransferase
VSAPLFDRLRWRDPISGVPMRAVVGARTPAGVPMHGALHIEGTNRGYPIVDAVVRATPELARRYAQWLEPFDLVPPVEHDGRSFQTEDTVDSFGFQWSWNSGMRSEADLRWRVAERFRLDAAEFAGKLVLDAGAGAGDQSRWLTERGASVVSVDLSSAIEVVARKLRMNPNWVGVQGDITVLPFADAQFEVVYCEGVIQHTRDSAMTVRELLRVLAGGGRILATHYSESTSRRGRLRMRVIRGLRGRLSRMERYDLLFVTGALARLAYVPGLRFLLRRSGAASYYDLMPDFKTTWTNTFDSYGNHAFQRHIPVETFRSYFDAHQDAETLFTDRSGIVVARKR